MKTITLTKDQIVAKAVDAMFYAIEWAKVNKWENAFRAYGIATVWEDILLDHFDHDIVERNPQYREYERLAQILFAERKERIKKVNKILSEIA